jgi:hypothetical protein
VFELHLEQFVRGYRRCGFVRWVHNGHEITYFACHAMQITAQDFTAEQFLAACQDAVTQEEPVPGSTLCKSMVEVVIAMQGYEHFVEMMIEAANQEEAGGELRSYTLARYTLARIFSHAHVRVATLQQHRETALADDKRSGAESLSPALTLFID